MKINPNSFKSNQPQFLTSDRMVVNILISTTIGLVVITGAVYLGGINPVITWMLSASVLTSIISTLLAARGITMPGRILVPGILTIVCGFIAYTRGGLYHISVSSFPVIIVLAALLLGIRGSFIFATLASIAAGIIGYADINGLNPSSVSSGRVGYDDIIVTTSLFFVTAIVLRVLILRLTDSILEAQLFGQAQETANIELKQLQSELEERVAERTRDLDLSNQRNERRAKQFEAIGQIARVITTIQDIDLLLPRITELISQQFGFYHTGIFLLDDNREFAILRAANSTGGKKMLARGHKLQVGQTGIVGYVTGSGFPRLALNTGTDAVFFDNPDLPETHSEIAFPLRIGGQIIGALDAQSTEPNAFTQEDVQIFSTLADQVSTAIQNARNFQETRKLLAESQAIVSSQMKDTWQVLRPLQNSLGYQYSGNTMKPLDQPLKTEYIEAAMKTATVTMAGDKSNKLAIPIRLRERVIGVIDLQNPENRAWHQDQIDIATAVADRLSLAMEAAILLQTTRRRADIERVTSTISTRISSSTHFETILQTAAEELSRALGGSDVLVQIEPASIELGSQ